MVLMERGTQSHPFENLIKAMDHSSLPRKSIFLCVWYTSKISHNVRGLKDPCNLSAELLRLHRLQSHTKDIHSPESMFLTTNRPKSLSLRVPTSQEWNPRPEAAHLLPQPGTVGFSLPKPGFPYSSLILSPVTQQILGTPKPDTPS